MVPVLGVKVGVRVEVDGWEWSVVEGTNDAAGISVGLVRYVRIMSKYLGSSVDGRENMKMGDEI